MPPKYQPRPQDIVLGYLKDKNNLQDLLYVESMDTFYIWRDGWYEYLSDQKLAKDLYKFCLKEHSSQRLSVGFVKDMVNQLRWQILSEVEKIENRYICFKDCLLDTHTWETTEHARDKYSTFYLPFEYHKLPDEHPNWDRFLTTSLVSRGDLSPDPEMIKFSQEMFGDLLFLNVHKKSVSYFLVGSGANGKSVMLDVAEDIIGADFRSAMNIETLTTKPFYLPHIIGKRINVSNEEESKFIKADKFKSLVTGDAQTADRKYGDPFSFKPNTKFIFASNKIPTFSDLNFGITRRIKIIPFNQRFDDTNPLTDETLPEKLKEEYPAIIKWAIEGAKRLQANRFVFTKSKQVDQAMEDFQGDISSAILFFRENYKLDEKGFVSNAELYTEYKVWCEEVGKKPMSIHNLGRDLATTFPNLLTKTGRDSNSKIAKGKAITRKNVDDEDDEPGVPVDEIDFGEQEKLI